MFHSICKINWINKLVILQRHYVKLQEELAKLPVPVGLEDLDEPFQLPAAPAPAPSPGSPPAPAAAPEPDEIDHDMEKIVLQVIDWNQLREPAALVSHYGCVFSSARVVAGRGAVAPDVLLFYKYFY